MSTRRILAFIRKYAAGACGLLLAGCVLGCVLGCDQGFFVAKGVVASDGGSLGRWRSSPEGCSRDPLDGAAPRHTTSVLTFLWEDPSTRDPLRDKHRATAPDAPMRLEIARDGTGYEATLHTVKTEGTRLDATVCATLRVETTEQRPQFAEGSPTLAGAVKMDCTVKGSHVTADVQFARCGY